MSGKKRRNIKRAASKNRYRCYWIGLICSAKEIYWSPDDYRYM